ncbi:MAG: hemerythrin domain-containing protein [Candidatus Margulisbacteria bacterium]|nr:hemerythrin domain-containing protein [Candidatus Margulisiibacteriota bacterium]
MEELMNTGIKKVIEQYPAVADILESYDIGCVTCGVGTCLLKDIVEIHQLTKEQEKAMHQAIANVVFPDQKVNITKPAKIQKKAVREISPPIQKLMTEHDLIKRLLALVPNICANFDVSSMSQKQLITESVDFIKTYADRFHHAKEEDILFKYFDDNSDFIQVMLSDHTAGRSYVAGILDGLAENNESKIKTNLLSYAELLTEHINKEDEILYPFLEKQLSASLISEMYDKFLEVDKSFAGTEQKYSEWVKKLEKNLIF